MSALTCSSEGCDRVATEALWVEELPGHVHDCPTHAHDVREWCAVFASGPLVGGECPADVCTADPIHVSQPTALRATP